MPHVSRRRIPDDEKALLDDALVHTFSSLKPPEVRQIFSTLLTETERVMLAKRLGIIYFLNEKVHESEIAEAVKVTRQTVARIRLQLLEVSQEAYRLVLEKLSSWERLTIFKGLLKEATKKVARTLVRGAGGRF